MEQELWSKNNEVCAFLTLRVGASTLALPLYWENQKINFAMRFSGYACSH